MYSWVVFAVGLLLGWRFKRRQLVIGLLVLFAAERALGLAPDAGFSSPGRVVFAAIALLLPLDLALLVWLTERSISAGAGRGVLVLILAEMLAVPLLARPELASLAPLLQHTFVPLGSFSRAWPGHSSPRFSGSTAGARRSRSTWPPRASSSSSR